MLPSLPLIYGKCYSAISVASVRLVIVTTYVQVLKDKEPE